MAYFQDLTPYSYIKSRWTEQPDALNVGWLDAYAIFPTAVPSTAFINKLWWLVQNPVNLCRGAHICHLCKRQVKPYGNGEIRVTGSDGKVYAAPVLIVHYVEAHHYAPPEEFINAVMGKKVMKNTKIYVAAPWIHKETARAARDVLVEGGFEVTSRWLDIHTDVQENDPKKADYLAEQAIHDVTDVNNADILILLNISKSEGKAVETGLALAWNKPVILVGERTNIFHWLPIPITHDIIGAMEIIDNWNAGLTWDGKEKEVLIDR